MTRRRAVRASEPQQILGSIYDAAFAPDRWPRALEEVGRTIGAQSAFFFSTHSDTDRNAVLHVHNQPREMLEDFTSFWHTQDAWARAARRSGRMRRGTLVVGSEMLPQAQFHRSAFHADFCRMHDIESIVGAVLFDGSEQDAMPFTNLSWYRGGAAEDFSLAERERVRPFLAHFQQALRIQRRIGWLANARSLEAFSLMRIASLVLDAGGVVHHHNACGGEFLAGLGPDCFQLGRLRALSSRSSPTLAEAISQARGGAAARMQALLPHDPPQVIGATLARIPQDQAQFDARAAGERFLLLVELPRAQGLEVARDVARLFQLSPAEVRVLGGLLDGRSPAQIAAAAGTSLATVRTQVSSLLAKSGTASQTELLVLLRGLR